MAIFRFFNVAAACSLDFQKVGIFEVGRVKRAKMRHRAKFHVDRSNSCSDMAIFNFSKMAAIHHLRFATNVFVPPTDGIWWSLSVCKIWLESTQ